MARPESVIGDYQDYTIMDTMWYNPECHYQANISQAMAREKVYSDTYYSHLSI